MAKLILGPIVRRVSKDGVTVWVETDGPCEVEVLDHRTTTFHVAGHHYAVVDVTGLGPGADVAYRVHLDGEQVWPLDDGFPPSTIRTLPDDGNVSLLIGSCQQHAPHEPPWTRRSDDDSHGLGPDALLAAAARMVSGTGARPHALVLMGDQVYADQPNPAAVAELEARRGGPPAQGWPQVTSFEEYTWLYRHAWSHPLMRWLLANVASFMIFDDHDIIDDWNTSEAWRERIEREPWWAGRIHGGLMAYWLYQHLGNAAFAERQDDELLAAVQAADDGAEVLEAFAARADVGTPGNVGHRWSHGHDLGDCRLLVLDSRNGRVVEEGRRAMLDEEEWRWFEERATGGVEHLLVVTSVPWILPRAIHELEAWNEQVVGGAWGRIASRVGEWLRQAIDLEHWAAFGSSFEDMAALLQSVGRGERGKLPASILVLSGDVHFGYVAEADLDSRSPIRQVVVSPFRQSSSMRERRAQRLALTVPLALLGRFLIATTPRAKPRFGWRITEGPWFDNNIAYVDIAGPRVTMRVQRAVLDDGDKAVLVPVLERDLTTGA